MKESKCSYCNNVFTYKTGSSAGKYCSNACQQTQQHQKRVNLWLNEGLTVSSKTAKRYLMDKNASCSCCGISEWNGLPLVLELEHKDGNGENNDLKNICLLCPNCHSQTATYKNKNKGNGRHYRRKRYSEGKSY
jgi:hypothetical protein